MSNKEYDYHANIAKVKKFNFHYYHLKQLKVKQLVRFNDHTLYITSQDGVSTPSPGGLYDAKMGVIDSNVICATCENKKVHYVPVILDILN